MAYMIEGGGSKTWSKAKKWLYQYETASSRLLAKITDVVVNHLVEQARAGAQVSLSCTISIVQNTIALFLKIII